MEIFPLLCLFNAVSVEIWSLGNFFKEYLGSFLWFSTCHTKYVLSFANVYFSWKLILCKAHSGWYKALVCYQLRKEWTWFQLGLQVSTLIIEIYTVHGSFAFNTNTHLLKWQGAWSLVDWMDALEHRCLAMIGLEKSPT